MATAIILASEGSFTSKIGLYFELDRLKTVGKAEMYESRTILILIVVTLFAQSVIQPYIISRF